jgi:hypothetical protein
MSISKKKPVNQPEPFCSSVFHSQHENFNSKIVYHLSWFGIMVGAQTMGQCNVLNIFTCQPYQIHCNMKIINDLQYVYEKIMIIQAWFFKKLIIYLIYNSFLR